jgi:hypothetical protein
MIFVSTLVEFHLVQHSSHRYLIVLHYKEARELFRPPATSITFLPGSLLPSLRPSWWFSQPLNPQIDHLKPITSSQQFRVHRRISPKRTGLVATSGGGGCKPHAFPTSAIRQTSLYRQLPLHQGLGPLSGPIQNPAPQLHKH